MQSWILCLRKNFNPRSREGSDASARKQYIITGFQSTLPRRERRRRNLFIFFHFRFQSTLPRRERRYRTTHLPLKSHISIHAPAKGATCLYFIYFRFMYNFNPRSREGSDFSFGVVESDVCISIHAPAKGATCTPIHIYTVFIFQSTLPRRERQFGGICLCLRH